MREFVITTDSATDFSAEMARALEVTMVPLTYILGSDSYYNIEGEGPDTHEFYKRISSGEPVQTSAPNVEAFKERFRPILEAGNDILHLAFSSGISVSYQNSVIAMKDMLEEFPDAKILVVDTLCASLGEGLIVHLAVLEKRKGKTMEEIRDFVEGIKLHICHWVTVGDLSQLRRGGRLSAGKAMVGNLLNMKPIIHVDNEGKLIPVESVKGRKRSLEALLKHMEERVIDPKEQMVYISHGDCFEDAQSLGNMIQEKLGVKSVTIGGIGPVVGAHSGFGTVALFFVGQER